MKSMNTQEAQQAFNVLQQQAQAPWQLQDDSLHAQWQFKNFLQGNSLITSSSLFYKATCDFSVTMAVIYDVSFFRGSFPASESLRANLKTFFLT
jgi:hypothetical protein